MPRVPDLLHRFRPAGAPGAAGVAGVPTDRVADQRAELAELFAQLATTEARCDEIAHQAQEDDVAARARAADQVRHIAASARERTASERADAMERARGLSQERAELELATAHEQAAQLRARAAERVPAHVALLTGAIRSMIAAARPADPR